MSATPLLIQHGQDGDGGRRDVFCFDGLQQPLQAAAVFDDTEVLDATGLVVLPGLLDLQVTGGPGIDVGEDPERIGEVGRDLVRHGVTAWLPTLVSPTPDVVERASQALREAHSHPDPYGAVPLGLHVEGLAPHQSQVLHQPGIAMVTLTPELSGGLTLIAELVDRGIRVAIGRSSADPSTIRAAIDLGAQIGTRLFHQMPPLGAREPGPAGALMADPRTVLGFVADGIHVSPEMLKIAWAALGPRRFWAVSDRVSPLSTCLHILRSTLRAPLEDVWDAGSWVPAQILQDTERGLVTSGARADLVLADPDDLTVVATVLDGRVVHDLRRG